MPDRIFLARLYFSIGILLAVASLVLWLTRPIGMFPPYLVTALLALACGSVCQWGPKSRPGGGRKS